MKRNFSTSAVKQTLIFLVSWRAHSIPKIPTVRDKFETPSSVLQSKDSEKEFWNIPKENTILEGSDYDIFHINQ
jgi:hypothetical protein